MPCARMAGHGTDHVGSGRCKFHGGCAPTQNGLYSKVVPETRKESYLKSLHAEDPKSMKEHIALLDGVILPGALARGEKAPVIEGQMDPLLIQMAAIECKSKVLKREHDINDTQKIKFTEVGLEMLLVEIVSIIAEYVTADILKKIIERFGTRSMALIGHDNDTG